MPLYDNNISTHMYLYVFMCNLQGLTHANGPPCMTMRAVPGALPCMLEVSFEVEASWTLSRHRFSSATGVVLIGF